MRRILTVVGVLLGIGFLDIVAAQGRNRVACYNPRTRAPQRCIPPFVNAAFNVTVEATNTCGEDLAEEYCVQTGITGATKSCELCEQFGRNSHPARFLTDFHNVQNQTWWQSSTMLQDGIQYPHSINLTLRLGRFNFNIIINQWFMVMLTVVNTVTDFSLILNFHKFC